MSFATPVKPPAVPFPAPTGNSPAVLAAALVQPVTPAPNLAVNLAAAAIPAPVAIAPPIANPGTVQTFVDRVTGVGYPHHGRGWTSTPATSLIAAVGVIQSRAVHLQQAADASHLATLNAVQAH